MYAKLATLPRPRILRLLFATTLALGLLLSFPRSSFAAATPATPIDWGSTNATATLISSGVTYQVTVPGSIGGAACWGAGAPCGFFSITMKKGDLLTLTGTGSSSYAAQYSIFTTVQGPGLSHTGPSENYDISCRGFYLDTAIHCTVPADGTYYLDTSPDYMAPGSFTMLATVHHVPKIYAPKALILRAGAPATFSSVIRFADTTNVNTATDAATGQLMGRAPLVKGELAPPQWKLLARSNITNGHLNFHFHTPRTRGVMILRLIVSGPAWQTTSVTSLATLH